MRTTTFIVLSLLLVACLPCFGFDYTITFTGNAASTTVDNVLVHNLTKGTSILVPSGNILNLTDAPTSVEQLNVNDESIHIYPTPVKGKSTVTFLARQAGSTQINVFSIDGKKIAGRTDNLQTGVQSFQLSLPNGSFVIQVSGNGYSYTSKLINQNAILNRPELEYIGTEKPTALAPQKSKGSTHGITTMVYSTGDQLLYKAVSGIYSTIVTDKPTGSKTTNFVFVDCTDGDGNHYTVVTIGTQTWMAENLRTTKYNDGIPIPLITDNTAWAASSTPAYCWYNNDVTSYKNTYGALYNWYTVNTAKLAPTGWHLPTDAEWRILGTILGGDDIAGGKLKDAGTLNWTTPNTSATNETGFSALPGGGRYNGGIFDQIKTSCNFWSSTDGSLAVGRMLNNNTNILRYANGYKSIGLSVRCLKNITPIVTTTAATIITNTSATSGGNITDDGGSAVTARGVCWSTSSNPTIALSTKTSDGIGTGVFTSSLTGLAANTTYYLRAYATYSGGTVYGTEVSFTTTSNTVTDIDGNVYHYITIGTQTWMVENLRTTKFNDGTAIPLVSVNTEWAALSTPAYCWYANDATTYKNKYGALYNWYTVSTAKLAPAGWHVPTDTEWTTLINFLGGNNVAGGKLKETGTLNWTTPNNGATNTSGFSALPGGYRGNIMFSGVSGGGYWWSATDFTSSASYRVLNYNSNLVAIGSGSKMSGFSVRCVKD